MKKLFFGLLPILLTMASTLVGEVSSELESLQHIDCSIKKKPSRRSGYGTYPHMPLEEGTSVNWSGYAALTSLTRPVNGSVTAVSGSWTVPSLSPSTDNTYSAFWVGIDGYASPTVEQIGTEHDWSSGSQSNYAWFEMYPNGSYEIVGFPVDAGDRMGGSVSYKGRNVFQLTLTNYTKNVYTIIPTSYTKSAQALRSSAEWIVEAPYLNTVLPLAHFGVAAFTNCTTTIRGITGGINSPHWIHDALTMQTQTGIVKSFPSNLGPGGESFTLTWKHE